jgi:hypothetical protein
VTLDGASFSSRLSGGQAGGGSPVGIPQEGVRGTRVVTSTYDVSRGQFSGGLIATTTRSGGNRSSGTLSWQLRDPFLQMGAATPEAGRGYTQNRVSGGLGGPILRDRWFYFASFTVQRRSDALYSLTPDDPLVLLRFGVAPQAVDTFLAVLSDRYGVTGRTGSYARTGTALSVLGRTDYRLSGRHDLALRAHLNAYGQENARIGFLETLDHGGEVETRGGGAIATLTSRLGGSWINELRASSNLSRRDQTPYEEVPEGRVRVASSTEEVGRGFSTLVFGGDRSMPSFSTERTLEVADELSFLWGDRHRIRAGIVVNHSRFEHEQSNNPLGSFEFASLDDFREGLAYRYTRQLSPRSISGAGTDLAAYVGDTWRPRTEVQVTGGVRLETSRFGAVPDRNEAIEERFGRRTDRIPTDVRVSPRIGFSWRLSEQGAPARIVRGGVGEFRGRAPYSIFAAAMEQTGLPGSESQLECVGEAVPRPDWSAYAADRGAIPSECAGGLPGVPARRTPSVTVIEPGFGAPRAWRGSLGYQTQLGRLLSATVDASYARGVAQTGARDLNLLPAPAFVLAAEGGRPVYAPAAAIDARSGAVPLAASRADAGLGHVLEVYSGLRNETVQLSLGANGFLPPRILVSGSYTWSRSRDEGGFGGGSPAGGLARTPTAGDPRAVGWATSDFERRHSLTAVVGVPLGAAVEVALIGRGSSGRPFTPLVGGDINGDGFRNDAAFVFDPAEVQDAELAAGMSRLLANAPGRVVGCLRGQLGTIAGRNSCRAEWAVNLDLRTSIRPDLPRLERRLSLSLDAYNLAAGLDELLHGASGVRGWGPGASRPDDVLLIPVGFEPAAGSFAYRVNETFGSRRAGRIGGGFGGSGFQVALTARLAVGAQQQGGAAMAGLATGGFGGGRGGGPGGRGGRGGPGGPGGFDPALLADRILPEPITPLIALRDTLGLTDEQVERLRAIADTLIERNEPIRLEIAEAAAGAAGGGGMGDLLQRMGPRTQEGRRNVQEALDRAREVLTPEQWRRVPAALRNALGGFGPGGGRPRG